MVEIKRVKVGEPLDIYREIQEINEDIFNGELDLPILEICHDPKLDGYMAFFDGIYHIGLSLGTSYTEGIGSIIHEMVHIWQHQRGMIEMLHDTTFNRKCKEAEKFYGFPAKTVQGYNNCNNYFNK